MDVIVVLFSNYIIVIYVKLTDSNNFFYKDKIKNISKDIFDKNYKKIIDILCDAFTIKNVPI